MCRISLDVVFLTCLSFRALLVPGYIRPRLVLPDSRLVVSSGRFYVAREGRCKPNEVSDFLSLLCVVIMCATKSTPLICSLYYH
jgi:hypothetical protein